jgi:hypothetical protein
MMSTSTFEMLLGLCLTLTFSGCEGNASVTKAPPHRLQSGISAGGDGAIAEFEDVVIDLGDVPLKGERDVLHAVIRVKNVGSEPLAFQRLVMSCGCTHAKPAQQQIEPGETGKIELQIEITSSGTRSVSVTIHSNTVGRPHTTVNIRWNAVAPIEVRPDDVDFGGIAPGVTVERTVELLQSKFGECSRSQIAIHPSFESSHNLTAVWSSPLHLRVRLTGGIKPGNFTEFIPLQLTDCWRKSIRIPVRWEVRPLVSLVPERILVSTMNAGETVQRTIVVRTTEPRIEVPTIDETQEARLLPSVISALQWERLNDQTLRGTLTIEAPDNPGAFHEQVALPVSLPANSYSLELRIAGFVIVR